MLPPFHVYTKGNQENGSPTQPPKTSKTSYSQTGTVHTKDDWETFRIIDEEPYRRSELNTELAQRCFTSLGLAAQHMPQLKSLTFFFMVSPTLGLTLFTDEATGKRFIQWQASRPFMHYMPDQRVADAWGLGLDDLEDLGRAGGSLFRVSLRQWPPVSVC